ncbi:sporulation-control protein [Cytobacillus oceanisediminis]|uniref:Sporulation-control protein n=1 Tax=Cytobacillus oceanisediminis TaxID=665099 RepID=A0A2V3A3A2_9BACI|nr:sporulation protein [Cytobacillus oceanisediminis]PWW30199.1 sporulation-control protein [Cytobacillus oceanisediminis]
MSFFNKVLASVGIGSAKVDTKLERDTVTPGEALKGVVEITGGNTEQKIDDIYLSLNTTYIKESDDKKYTVSGLIDRFRLAESFTLAANERKEIPFTFNLPSDTPLSFGKTKIWVATGLDIKNAVDPTDQDFIRVVPNPLMDSVLNAVSNMGFRLREAECEQAPNRLRHRLPFIQEFEFVPVSGPFRGRLDELEVVFFPQPSGETEILIQVDRKARGLGGFLAEALEMDETYVRFTVTNGDIPYMQQKLQSMIAKYAN